MSVIELTTYYDVHLHCPFCGLAATHNLDGAWEVKGCKHLQLLTASDFILFMSKRMKKIVTDAGYEIVDEDNDINLSNPSDEDDWPNLIKLASQFPDVVIFEQVVGPPSLEVSHTIFAYNDDDCESFGKAL